jgi:hypothetical protein
MTGTLAEYATGVETLSGFINEDLVASLDASVFSTATGANQPSGILAGVTPGTASTATNPTDAMLADLENLGGQIADNGGSGNCVYIVAAKQFASARLRLRQLGIDVEVWPCPALAAGVVIAVEPLAFVSAFGTVPRVEASDKATVHADTAAQALCVTGTPNVVAAPLRSSWRQDLITVRCMLDATWCMRQAGMVAYLTGAHWGGP